MLVRAIRPGVYGRYRNEGEEFEISDEKDSKDKVLAFSKKWMEPAGKAAVAAVAEVSKEGKAAKSKDVI